MRRDMGQDTHNKLNLFSLEILDNLDDPTIRRACCTRTFLQRSCSTQRVMSHMKKSCQQVPEQQQLARSYAPRPLHSLVVAYGIWRVVSHMKTSCPIWRRHVSQGSSSSNSHDHTRLVSCTRSFLKRGCNRGGCVLIAACHSTHLGPSFINESLHTCG